MLIKRTKNDAIREIRDKKFNVRLWRMNENQSDVPFSCVNYRRQKAWPRAIRDVAATVAGRQSPVARVGWSPAVLSLQFSTLTNPRPRWRMRTREWLIIRSVDKGRKASRIFATEVFPFLPAVFWQRDEEKRKKGTRDGCRALNQRKAKTTGR